MFEILLHLILVFKGNVFSFMQADKTRQYFVDNLRVAMTLLVVAHHAMITYSGTGGWYYIEGREDTATVVVSAIFCGVNQAFFMALFFLISAYFTAGSFDRKGAGRFYADRLLRLGIPMVVYDLVIHPIMIFAMIKNLDGYEGAFTIYIKEYFSSFHGVGQGPLWFLEALLIFSLLYSAGRTVAKASGIKVLQKVRPFPGVYPVLAFIVFAGVAAFVVRLWFPVGYSIPYTNLQLPYFVLYILLYAVGIAAYRNNWLMTISDRTAKGWFMVAAVGIVLMPVILIAGGALENKTECFTGGFTWQSFVYAMWEPFICVGMCAWLVMCFRRKYNRQSSISKFLSDNAYTVYILQGPALVFFALLIRAVSIHPLLKFVLLFAMAVTCSYMASHFIRKLPYAKKIL